MAVSGKKLLGEILTDPGTGFCFCNLVCFSSGRGYGFAAILLCTLAILTLKILSISQPVWLSARLSLGHRLQNRALPLRLLGCTLAFIAASMVLQPDGQPGFVAPLTCLMFAIGNLMLANSLEKGPLNAVALREADKVRLRQICLNSLRQAETWLALGMLGLGLLSGPQSVFVFPFILTGYGIALRNITRNLPEHQGHPKIWYALANAGFGIIAIAEGHAAIAFADFLSAFYMILLEGRLTPSGLSSVWREFLKSARISLTRKIRDIYEF